RTLATRTAKVKANDRFHAARERVRLPVSLREANRMTDWVRASNPTAPINNEAEATAAARASAIAIFLGVLWGIVGIVYLMTAGQAVMEAAMAQASADAPEMAGMAGVMTQAALWMSVGLVVIQLVLGLVQWAKPNIVIPIIFVILVAFGLVSGLAGM